MAKRKNGGKDGLQEIHAGSAVTWINVHEPTAASLAALRRRYPFFLEDDLRDCLPPYERPKLLMREQYLFIVLIFPVLDRKSGTIVPYEVDMFVGHDFLVTSHRGTHPTLATLVEACGDGSDKCTLRQNDSPLRLALDIVHGLTTACYPMVTQLSNELIATERRLFDERSDGETTRAMLRLRTNVIGFRKAMQGSDNVLRKLIERAGTRFPVAEFRQQVEDINGHSREIREFLESDKDSVGALYDAHLSLVSYRTNQATKTLTALALIIFPMNLVAAIFSMRAEHMPLLGRPGDFWMMLAAIFATMLSIVWLMKKKEWL